MNASIDWLGLGVVVGVFALLAVLLRLLPAGRIKRILRGVFVLIVLLVCAMMLWNVAASWR
jgi:hypothetical protein